MADSAPLADAPAVTRHPDVIPALVAASAEFGRAVKRRAGQVGGGTTKYANFGDVVDAVRDALQAHGLAFVQLPQPTEKAGAAVRTMILHESGTQFDAGTVFVPSMKADAHGIGSALTYARRYGLCAALGVVTEDDDGQGAMKRPRAERAPPSAMGTPGAMPPQAKVQQNADKLWQVANDRGLAAAEDAYSKVSPAMREALHDTLSAIQDAAQAGEVQK